MGDCRTGRRLAVYAAGHRARPRVLAPLSAQRAAAPKRVAQEHWVPTWATSQQLVRVDPAGPRGAAARRPPRRARRARRRRRNPATAQRRRPPRHRRPSATTRRRSPPLPPLQTLHQSDGPDDAAHEHWRKTRAGEARQRVQRHAGGDRRRAHRRSRHGVGHRHRLGSRADVRRPAVDQDGAGHGRRERPGRPDVRAADRPRRQPLLPRRYRRADDARDRAAADLRLG